MDALERLDDLREWVDPDANEALNEIAAEVQRLRTDLDNIAEQNAHNKAEVERLREALEAARRIVTMHDVSGDTLAKIDAALARTPITDGPDGPST